MKNIFLLLIFNLLAGAVISQNISFFITVDDSNAPTTSVVSIFGQADAGTESISAETIVIYYDDNQATINPTFGSPDLDVTPTTVVLGWDPAANIIGETDVMPADVPAGMNPSINKRIQMDLLDGVTFTGSIFDTNPTLVATMTFNNVTPGAPISIGDGVGSDPGSAVYLNSLADGLTSHPIDINGAQNQSLPIDMRTFEAEKLDREVLLSWTTASEVNSSHFEIERSQDLDEWKKLGEVAAMGESSVDQDYEFLDSNLPLNARTNHKIFYYRLKMVDNDGFTEYSEIRTVRFDLDGEGDFLVYPNPAINEVYVNLSNINDVTGNATVNIIDMNGKLVKRVPLTSNDDIAVDVSNLTSGVYYFIAQHGDKTYTQKVIKVD